jgi:hypothetical protein
MAEENVEETTEQEESNGNGNGHSNGHQIGRMAVIAAASGATAYAAKKALESRSSSSSSGSDDEGEGEGAGTTKTKSKSKGSGKKRAESSASLVNAAVSSGWDVAKDSLIPIIEDAATKAGGYAADRSPEVVRDVVIPRFISGFEKARGKERGDKSDA